MSPHPSLRDRNDLLRTTFIGGQVMLTGGILALSEERRNEILTQVRIFDHFSPDNDPHGEHDFGAVIIEGVEKIFWKIDYYDRSLMMGSPDVSDPTQTVHVLTIMLASEY